MIAGVAALGLVLLVLWVAHRHVAKQHAKHAEAVAELPEPPVVTAPKALAPREPRTLVLRERVRQRACAYCDHYATEQRPLIVQERSMADRLYVALGATPPTRWRVVVRPDPERFPETLCPTHAEMVRGHQEKFIAALMVESAEMTERQRLAVYEYTEHSLDEIVDRTMNEIRKRKPGTP